MTPPIQPVAPINTTVTIQPVTTLLPHHENNVTRSNPLASLASGTLIEGFIVNRDAQSNPIVRTTYGDLRVTSDVFLKTGSEVLFRVDTNQTSLARILSVDGLTPQDYSAKNTHGITQDTISASLLQQASTQVIGATDKTAVPKGTPVLQAIVLQGTSPDSLIHSALKASQAGTLPLLAQLAQLRAGTSIRLTVLDLKLPPLPIELASLPENFQLDSLLPARPTMQRNPSANSAPIEAKIALPPTATHALSTEIITTANSASLATTLPHSENRKIAPALNASTTGTADAASSNAAASPSERIAHYGKNVTTAYSTQPLAAASTRTTSVNAANLQSFAANEDSPALEATVIGHEADGANILHTPFATLKLYTSQPLPTGTILVVQATPDAHTPAIAVQPTAPLETFTENTARPWTTLDEALSFLKASNPEIAQEVVQNLPKANHTLASGLLFFIGALKQGDIDGILGNRALRLLELSAPNILKKLRSDMGQLQTNFTASPVPQWMVAQLPLMLGEQLEHARLLISKEEEKDTNDTSHQDRGQRFILEAGMSQLGPIQLDGFVRSLQKTKSFDLIVRSANPLDKQVIQGISDIFYTSMTITGMRGRVDFQAGRQHFVMPIAPIKLTPDTLYSNTILA